jgi:protein-disulfide isomerase-like protein with CxxC motif
MVRRIQEAFDSEGRDAAKACFMDICVEQNWTKDELKQGLAVFMDASQLEP